MHKKRRLRAAKYVLSTKRFYMKKARNAEKLASKHVMHESRMCFRVWKILTQPFTLYVLRELYTEFQRVAFPLR